MESALWDCGKGWLIRFGSVLAYLVSWLTCILWTRSALLYRASGFLLGTVPQFQARSVAVAAICLPSFHKSEAAASCVIVRMGVAPELWVKAEIVRGECGSVSATRTYQYSFEWSASVCRKGLWD